MDERMHKIQSTLRRWWWAIGGWVIAVLVGGCCPVPVVMYGPPPVPEYGPPPTVVTPMVLYGPPPPTPDSFLVPSGPAGELLSLLSIAAFAVVGMVWVGRHRNK